MIHLNILLFGGRGASSYQNKKERATQLNKTIKSLNKQIKSHKEKIEKIKSGEIYANYTEARKQGLIKHWGKEIKAFEKGKEDAKKEKNELR